MKMIKVDSNYKPEYKVNKPYLKMYDQETGEVIFEGNVEDFMFSDVSQFKTMNRELKIIIKNKDL